jgi:hypothetical protein
MQVFYNEQHGLLFRQFQQDGDNRFQRLLALPRW